jgi:hypothetical protein
MAIGVLLRYSPMTERWNSFFNRSLRLELVLIDVPEIDPVQDLPKFDRPVRRIP